MIVDDDAVIRDSLVGFIDRHSVHTVVGQAANGAEAVDLYADVRPDLVLMDLQMPVLDGIGAIARIRELEDQARIVALTTFDSRDHVVAALRAGAAGYLLKDTRPADLLAAIESAMQGDMPLSPAVRRALVTTLVGDGVADPRPDNPLTPRQSELVRWLAQGLTNAQISQHMYLSEGSVKQYLMQIGDRLGVSSRTQILIRSVQLGIVDPRQALGEGTPGGGPG